MSESLAGEYPSADEFKRILLARSLDSVVRDYLFQGTPFAFRDQPALMDTLRDHLCRDESLNLSRRDIIVVGSGKLGFSLNPYNFPRCFTDDSDFDVLVVDAGLFDTVWTAMLRWHYPRKGIALDGADRRWVRQEKRAVLGLVRSR